METNGTTIRRTSNGTRFSFDTVNLPIVDGHTWHSLGAYVATKINGKTKYLHRLIMGEPNRRVVDHVDGNPSNNTRENLRVCTIQQNIMGKRAHPNKTSRFKGVSWSATRKMWLAYINKNYKTYYLGGFSNENDARDAYDKAALIMFGNYAKTNGN